MGPGREWAIKAIEAWAADQAKGDTQKYIRDNRTVKVLGDNDHGTLFCTLMPQLAGDLLILNTGYQGDLAAFDLKTGKQRWCQKGVIQQKQSPTVWPLDGKYYVLHASGNAKENGALVCTDAATGERMWLIQDAPTPEDMGPTVSGPYIVVQGNWPKVRDGKVIGIPLTCFKADAKGATRLWTFDALQVPEYTAAARGWCAPVIYKGHVYFRSQAGDNVPPVFFACVEVASGKVKGLIRTIQSASYCSWMAAEGRAVTNWEVFDADPANFRMLFKPGGKAKMKQGQPFDLKYAGDALAMLAPNGMIQRRDGTWAKSVIEIARTYQTNILAGGFYYWRGPHHIYCYDLRKK
jgi:outer membrane protein assembly factor BamB